MNLLQSTNGGRFVLVDFKLNNGSLSDEGQTYINLFIYLLIYFIFQDKSKYV